MAKLTRDDIYLIRRKKALGCLNTVLMRKYNLSYAELRQILDEPNMTKGDAYGNTKNR